MASGVFDLLHMGHVHYLSEAKSLGDELIVVVATDETVRRNKHTPIIPEEMRRDLVASLKPVDRAVVGHTGDVLAIVEELQPDIIALGYDQEFKHLEQKLHDRNLSARLVVCSPFAETDLHGTRRIIRKIEEKLQNGGFYLGEL
jgi:FAD synthetase